MSRPRTRSLSQSSADSSDDSVDDALSKQITRSTKRSKLAPIADSPEPQPSKKLSFTPAISSASSATPSRKGNVESAESLISAKKATTSTRKSKTAVEVVGEVPKSSKKVSSNLIQEGETKKEDIVVEVTSSTKTAQLSTNLQVESEVANQDVGKSVKKSSKSARKIGKAELATASEEVLGQPTAVSEEVVGQPPAIKVSTETKLESKRADRRKDMDVSAKGSWNLSIHRCRFVGWMPDPIHALAANQIGDKVAVARAGGDLELVDTDGRWSIEARIAGPATGGDVRALVWVDTERGPVLVGATLGGLLFTADWGRGLRALERDSLGGAVWSLATPPASDKTGRLAGPMVAAGCEDGSVRCFAVGEESLELMRSVGPLGDRITSLAFTPNQLGVGPLFAGTADGTIHRLDLAAGRNTARMTLARRGTATGSGTAAGAGRRGRPSVESVVVWALVVLEDGTVVSADSDGFVQFWDGHLCAHTSRVETHTADVLCLAASSDHRSIFASGIDHKVVCLTRLGGSGNQSGGMGIWGLAHAYRSHQLDVRGLCVVRQTKEQDGSTRAHPRELLLSGSLDTKLCTYHVRRFTEQRPTRLWPFPYHPVVSLAPSPRLVLAQHRDLLCLWRLPPKSAAAQVGQVGGGHVLLAEVKLKVATSIVCSAISGLGDLIAASDAASLRLLRVHGVGGSPAQVHVTKVALPLRAREPAQRLCFGSGRLISATQSGGIHVISLPPVHSAAEPSLEHTFWMDSSGGDSPGLSLPFSAMAVSPDGQWLAVAGSGNSVSVFSLDRMALFWSLPRPLCRVTALAFHPAPTALLAATTVDNRFLLYEIEARKIADWSSDNVGHLPSQLVQRPDVVVGAVFSPEKGALVLRSHGFLCFVDLAAPVPLNARIHPPSHLAAKNDLARRSRISRNAVKPSTESKVTSTVKGVAKRQRSNSSGSAASEASVDLNRRRSDSMTSLTSLDETAERETFEDHDTDSDSRNFAITLKYRPVIFADFLSEGELLVVEEPWLKIMQRLPDPLFRQRYGT